MFGYVRPAAPDLRVRQYALYRGIYCGLCRVMRKNYSFAFSLSLSYDFVFYAAVRAAAYGERFELKPRFCLAHPTRKRPMAEENRALRDAAAAAAILCCGKAADDVNDSGGIRKILKKLIYPIAAGARKKAVRDPLFAAADAEMNEHLRGLYELERSGREDPDAAAEYFGRALAALTAVGFDRTDGTDGAEDAAKENGRKKRILSEIGLRTGRWIYLADAIDDHAGDAASGGYNPFGASLPLPEDAEEALRLECGTLFSACELLCGEDAGDVGEVIANIVACGMPATAKKIIGESGSVKKKKKEKQNKSYR